MSRSLPYQLLLEKDKQQNAPIDLIVVEVTTPYISTVQSGSTTTSIIVSENVNTELSLLESLTEYGDGYGWLISCEKGNNVGAKRRIAGYNSTTKAISFTPALDSTPATTDKVRIAKVFYFACWNKPVTFYIPDDSDATDVEQVYSAAPMRIESIGTTSSGEILGIVADIANVDKVIGNAVQEAGGLQGNRVNILKVFDGYTDQGKEFCLKDTMYIDTVTINSQKVEFTLESKFNVMDVKIPLCNYSRTFCRWRYLSSECLGNQSSLTIDTDDYPLADESWCDHSLIGPNGCLAHSNSRRFGGFPAIPSRG